MLIQSFVNAVLLNRHSIESETPIKFASIKRSTIVHTERAFASGDRVRNTKTGETGAVAPVSPKDIVTTPVIYDKEFEEWGTIWDVPTYRLEKLP